MVNFAICDDNVSFLNNLYKDLNRLIVKNDFDARVVFKSSKVNELLDFISKNSVDVLFLDIDLSSDINGINVAEKIRAHNKNIYFIFTTGHLEYAFLAFQVKAFDYLPKPITFDRLEKTVLRLFDDISSSSCGFITLNNKTFVNQNDICYIRKDGMKIVFNTAPETFETYSSFHKLLEQLPSNFVRCHKSYIVNINNISHIESSTNTIYFGNDTRCYIGPKYKSSFMEVINNEYISNNMDSSYNA